MVLSALSFLASMCMTAAPLHDGTRRCSCIGGPGFTSSANAAATAATFDAVFEGRVVSMRIEDDSTSPKTVFGYRDQHVVVTISIGQRWRGAAADTIVVRTTPITTMCGFTFKVDERFLVFARNYKDRPYVDKCSPTAAWSAEAARAATLLGRPNGPPS